MKKSFKTSILIVLIITFLLQMTLTAFAAFDTSDSKPITRTEYGYTYTFCAKVAVDGNQSWAYSDISSTSSMPAGYMGAKAHLWHHSSSGDILKASGPEIYNSSGSVGVVSPTSKYTGSGYFYSQGLVYIYDGTKYITLANNPTAYLYAGSSSSSLSDLILNDFSNSRNQIKPYKINKNGETYGYAGRNADLIGEEPDLIAAYDTNDNLGYVRATDLESAKPKTPEEAVAITLQNLKGKTINVYDKDGETVIGTFEIKPGS